MAKNLKSTMVLQSITGKIESGEFKVGTKLPPIRELAAMFEASSWTINYVLRELANLGLVVRLQGSGVYVKGRDERELAREKKLTPSHTRAQEIAGDIVDNIVKGNFGAGTQLPSVKALLYQYGTTKRTLAVALGIVKDKELIHKKGTAYVIGQESYVRMRARVKRIHLVGELPMASQGPRRRAVLYESFTKELQKWGVTSLEQVEETDALARSLAGVDATNTAGFFYGPNYRGGAQIIQKRLALLSKVNVPVAFFDACAIVRRNPGFQIRPSRLLFPLGIDNFAAGRAVGMHLATFGHRSIAYFGFFDSSWSLLRSKGTELGLARTIGPGAQLLHYKTDLKSESMWGLMYHDPQAAEKTVSTMVSKLFKGYAFSHMEPSVEICANINMRIQMDMCRRHMQPLFEKALERADITAWVCEDEELAHVAMEYLRQAGVKVPDRLSVICIDDTIDTMTFGIDAYDFQVAQMGYLAAHAILGDIPVRKSRKGMVEVPGRIIERGSVKRNN